MCNTNPDCRLSCRKLSILVSVVVAIIAAILRYTAVITITSVFSWTIFGIAVVYLGILLAVSPFIQSFYCVRPVLARLRISIPATILASLLLLGISFAATSIISAIITGALFLFFSLTILSVSCLIKCITD